VPRRVAVITRLSISFCVSRRGSILIMPIHDGQMSGSSLTSSFLTGYPYALPAPNCRALPPGEFNGTIPELLLFVLKVSWRQLKPFLLMLQPTMLQTRLKSYKQRRPETVSRQLVPERGNDWRRRSKIQQHFWSTEASYKFSKTINLAIANRLRVGSGHTVTTTNFPRGWDFTGGRKHMGHRWWLPLPKR